MIAQPIDITLLQKSHLLVLTYADGQKFSLPCNYLRQHSPSAEMRHPQSSLPIPKQFSMVNIVNLHMVGNYGIKLIFDDGHDTGIYSWEYLYQLAKNSTNNNPE